MSDWANWKRKHRQDIAHVARFEERFVDMVLSRIPLIKPDDVVPQFPFVDNNGKNRRIDFMIINPDCGLLLPIELDGRDKRPGQEAGYISQADWDDFLERQNSIIESFGMVLRFTNSRLINNPRAVQR